MSPADDYRALLARLFQARRFGVDLSLDRIRALLFELGDPHLAIGRRVAVAGTNGKGSTAAFIASIAKAADIRAGVFSSPHLLRFAERFAIDGEPAADAAIVEAAGQVSAAGGDRLTFFEQCTAIAAWLLCRAEVELGIFEVGLGGRLDATAALASELVVITGVSYDHCDVLGHQLSEIAFEKAGAIAAGGTAIIGLGGAPESPELLEAAARAAGAARIVGVTAADRGRLPELGVAGDHQRDNAAAAAACARELGIDEAAIAAGLAAVRLPGRLERIGDVILDGAHNPEGARALARELARNRAPTTAVIAVSRGRDPAAICAPLAGAVDRVIASALPGDRGLPASEVADAAAAVLEGAAIEKAPDIAGALERARAGAPARVVVFGSLYAVAAARGILTGLPTDPIAIGDPVSAPSAGGRTP